jgi:hypothetical protein
MEHEYPSASTQFLPSAPPQTSGTDHIAFITNTFGAVSSRLQAILCAASPAMVQHPQPTIRAADLDVTMDCLKAHLLARTRPDRMYL